jgi:hypothetical protein
MSVQSRVGMQIGGSSYSCIHTHSDQVVEQKLKPVKLLARNVDLALIETGYLLGMTNTMNNTTNSMNKPLRQYFKRPELRKINVLSKKEIPAWMFESSKTFDGDHIKVDEQINTNQLQHPVDVTYSFPCEMQQLLHSHSNVMSQNKFLITPTLESL